MVDRRRYAMHGRFGSAAKRQSGLQPLYRGRAASSFKDLYETDHAEKSLRNADLRRRAVSRESKTDFT